MQTPTVAAPVEETVRQFIADNYMYRVDGALADTDSFLGGGIIDSMGILELVTFVEETFEIRMSDNEVVPDNLDSVAKVSAYVRRKQAAANGKA